MKDLSYYLTFGKRYLVIGILAYITAAYIGINIDTDINTVKFTVYSAIYAGLTAVLCIPIIISKASRGTKYTGIGCMLIIILFILGFSRSVIYTQNIKSKQNIFGSRATICGIVKTVPAPSSSGKSMEFDVDVYSVNNDSMLKKPIRVKVFADTNYFNGNDITFGSKIMCSVKIMNDTPPYKGAFSYSRYLLQNNIICSGYTRLIKSQAFHTLAEVSVSKLSSVGYTVRNYITNLYSSSPCANDEKALINGILVGDRDGFSEDLYTRFSQSGFMHIAAVSGMHTSYLLLLITCILSIFRFSKRFICIPTIPILILFAAVSLFTPSVCRAVIMMSVMLVASAVIRRSDSITSLAIAALILVVKNPYYLESASFLMSFGATLSILVFYAPLKARLSFMIASKPDSALEYKKLKYAALCIPHKLTEYIVLSITLSLCGTLGLSYFTAKMFGSIQWGSIIGSIVVLPIVALIFIAGYANCIVALVSKPISNLIIKFLLNPSLIVVNNCAKFFSNRVFRINTYTPPKSFFIIFLVICTGIYIMLLPPKESKADCDNESTD